MGEKIVRCVTCNKEFTEEELRGANACPFCGDKGIPCTIKDDVTIKINWHELRILTIWAENWEGHFSQKENKKSITIACIARRLQHQFPDKTPLTLAGEIEGLKDSGLMSDIKTNVDLNKDKLAGEFNP